jgi:hypothetical protein
LRPAGKHISSQLIGALLVAAGLIETVAGSLRREARQFAMAAGIVTALAGLDRVGQPLRAQVHVPEAAGVGQEVADLRIAVASEVVARDAAGEQQLVDQSVHAGAVVGRAPPPPRLTGHGSFDVEGGAHTGKRKSRGFCGLGAAPVFCG